MDKILKNQQGSIFIMLVFIMSLLSVLGLSLMTLSTTNFVMNDSYIDSNSAFYRADGIIEQIYGIIEQSSRYYYGNELIHNVNSALEALEQRENNISKREYAHISCETAGSQPILFTVTVSFSIGKITKKIQVEFEVYTIVRPLLTNIITCGENLLSQNNIILDIKFAQNGSEVMHVGGEIDETIHYKDQSPIVENSEEKQSILNSIASNSSNTDIINIDHSTFFFAQTSGRVLEINIDSLDGKEGFIFCTEDILFTSNTDSLVEVTVVVVGKKNVLFRVPEGKQIHLNDLSPKRVEEIAKKSSGLGYFSTVTRTSWKEIM